MILKSRLEEVVDAQHEWAFSTKKCVERECLRDVEAMPGFAMIVTGIRRCGKSTMMRQVMKRYDSQSVFFLDFDDIHLTGFEADDFTRLHAIIVDRKVREIFFDEIQLVPNWEVFIHQLLREDYLVYITGSNASMLSVELGTHLTGRHLTSELYPFSYHEFLDFTKDVAGEKSLSSHLMLGGMPEYLALRDRRIPLALLDDILLRDIAIRRGIRNVEPLKHLALYLLTNVAKPFSGTRLTSIAGNISTSTVLEYIDFLRDAYLIDTIGQYATSVRTTIRNPKKVYAFDMGMAHSLTLSQSADMGRLLENYVFLQLRRRHRGHIYYYNGRGECDFVVTGVDNNPLALFQVCLRLTDETVHREVEGLCEAMRELHLTEGTIVTLSDEDALHVSEGTIHIVKAYTFAG